MWRFLIGLFVAATFFGRATAQAPREAPGSKLLIAFASLRDRPTPPYAKIYFYEHDGVANGRIVGSIDVVDKGPNSVRSDIHPSLTHDGRYCAFPAQLGIQDGGRIEIWDRQTKQVLPLPMLNDAPMVHRTWPSISGDGKRITFAAWAWPGVSARWDVLLYDVSTKKLMDLPHLNTEKFDERMPAISGEGRFIAYTSNAPGGVGLTDIYLYDQRARQVLTLSAMNSKYMEAEPSLTADGRLIAFVSDRPGGSGGRDIYLFDRVAGTFLPLPGLNSVAHEQSPSISFCGRYIAFVSERIGGPGERDIYLYDRETRKLLPTPGMNSKRDDFDPCVIVLKPVK
jgi:Tol biopolymer transport system component